MRAPILTFKRARALRRRMTLPETILWQRIRRGQLGGLQFRRQHPIGPYILDFFCPARRFAIEIDGAVHASGEQLQHDRHRDDWLARRGIVTVRVATGDILRDESLDNVLLFIEQMAAPSTAFGGPPPPKTGEEPDARKCENERQQSTGRAENDTRARVVVRSSRSGAQALRWFGASRLDDVRAVLQSGAIREGRMSLKLYVTALTVEIVALAISFACAKAAEPMAAGHCKPVSRRTHEVGCWILADNPVGPAGRSQTFWHLDVYPSRAAAEAARSPRGTVVTAFRKVWLLTIEAADWRAAGGTHIATIGPLPVKAGTAYSAQFMEGDLDPGMTSAVHKHSGPEAWYTLTGEACLETPRGAQKGRAGGPFMVVPGDVPMLLTATGKERRRAFALVLHESARPAITVVRDWQPKGLCAP